MLSASAVAAGYLGLAEPQGLVGSDLKALLCASGSADTLRAVADLESQLEAQQEGAARLQLAGSSGGCAARWLAVSVSALPGARYAWALEQCKAPEQPPAAGAAALQQQQQWQPSAVEAAALTALPQPVWCIDSAGRVLFANPAFAHLVGCSQDGVTGRRWAQLLLPPGGAAAADEAPVQRLQAAAAAGRPAQERVHCLAAGGFCGLVSLSPLPPPSGGSSPAAVCTLLGGPGEAGSGTALVAGNGGTAAAPQAGPGGPNCVDVPPQLAQLCNQALASTSESVLIADATQPGNPICWVNKAFERLTGGCSLPGI